MSLSYLIIENSKTQLKLLPHRLRLQLQCLDLNNHLALQPESVFDLLKTRITDCCHVQPLFLSYL